MKPGDRICVAVSGGADSVALLLTLHTANATKHDALGVGLSAVHVHHGIRGVEADTDQQFVEALCKKLDIPLHLHHASIPERIAKTGETIEEAPATSATTTSRPSSPPAMPTPSSPPTLSTTRPKPS